MPKSNKSDEKKKARTSAGDFVDRRKTRIIASNPLIKVWKTLFSLFELQFYIRTHKYISSCPGYFETQQKLSTSKS